MEDRSFHCVDGARNKYLVYRNNEWTIDIDANQILREAYPKIIDVFDIDIKRGDDMQTIDRKMRNIDQVRDLEKYGRRKILKKLNKKTLLKNNIKSIKN